MKKIIVYIAIILTGFSQSALVFQSDFGLKDGAVAAMKGVAYSVSSDLQIFDITHEIPAFNIWEASYRLSQSASYWPAGTVFVSVVDPGVGTDRKSVVLKTKTGHYFVTPDNGTLGLIAEQMGIAEVRQIDEAINRLKNSEASYTFHGRDVYAYTGARLAAKVISFEQVGKKLEAKVITFAYQKAEKKGDHIFGNIPVLDPQYGNVWTNIPRDLFRQIEADFGDQVNILIKEKDQIIYDGQIPYVKTFASVEECQPVLYLNSLNQVAIGLNQGNFAKKFCIESGNDWSIEIFK